MDSLINIIGLLGLGSVLGSLVQYAINKKSIKYEKLFEAKLLTYRKLYRQIYQVYALNYEELNNLGPSSGIKLDNAFERSGLDIETELGDALFHAEGKLRQEIETLIYTLYIEVGIFGKGDLQNMKNILDGLQKDLN